jgi:hypothetical protein
MRQQPMEERALRLLNSSLSEGRRTPRRHQRVALLSLLGLAVLGISLAFLVGAVSALLSR